MKKKIVIAVIVISLFAAPVFAGKKAKIYDENSRWVGFVENGRIYDSDYHYRGKVEKSGRIYDEKSNYKGKVEKQRDGKKSRYNHDDEDNDD
jgi:hypothetical protein